MYWSFIVPEMLWLRFSVFLVPQSLFQNQRNKGYEKSCMVLFSQWPASLRLYHMPCSISVIISRNRNMSYPMMSSPDEDSQSDLSKYCWLCYMVSSTSTVIAVQIRKLRYCMEVLFSLSLSLPLSLPVLSLNTLLFLPVFPVTFLQSIYLKQN
jgi:hypothetical protein